MKEYQSRLEQVALEPLVRTGRGFYLLVGALVGIILVALYAYSTQLDRGLIVTGMGSTQSKVMYGVYIVNFVFFIGISHAGTLISAILRVTKAEWRTPVTRMAEFITVVALMIGGLAPIIDLGRPDRIINLVLYGRWQSPVVWDVLSISTYLTGSLIYLYLPLIPDLALCRDRVGDKVSAPKRWLYRLLSVGWKGAPDQQRNLNTALTVMMILIIPVAVSVHTVVSWIFAMTLRVGWNSTMYGAYFVAGAIFSGIATLIIAMAILRRVYRLEQYITRQHFLNLGYMMAALGAIMIYFNLSEYVTAGYKMAENEPYYFKQMFAGSFTPYYWFYFFAGLIAPMLMVLIPWTRNVTGVIVAAVLVNVAMWIERYLVVVPTLLVPQTPYAPVTYTPTWVEWSITAGAFALFALIIAVFSKLVPVLSVWEVAEQHEHAREMRHVAVPAFKPIPVVAGGSGVEQASLGEGSALSDTERRQQ